eukprot:4739808-Lingulodinium_polyedra.AAC.1
MPALRAEASRRPWCAKRRPRSCGGCALKGGHTLLPPPLRRTCGRRARTRLAWGRQGSSRPRPRSQ